MYKRCRAFPSEYQFEFTKKKLTKSKPIKKAIENLDNDNLKNLDKNIEKIVRECALERLQTVYRSNYKDYRNENYNEEEIDLGNELLIYLKNLYRNSHLQTQTQPRQLPDTSTRILGYVSPQHLNVPLSNYQDTYGRTGSKVIFKNVKHIQAVRRRRKIRSKLEANEDLKIPTTIFLDSCKSYSNKN